MIIIIIIIIVMEGNYLAIHKNSLFYAQILGSFLEGPKPKCPCWIHRGWAEGPRCPCWADRVMVWLGLESWSDTTHCAEGKSHGLAWVRVMVHMVKLFPQSHHILSI